jgi:hypothetical protein
MKPTHVLGFSILHGKRSKEYAVLVLTTKVTFPSKFHTNHHFLIMLIFYSHNLTNTHVNNYYFYHTSYTPPYHMQFTHSFTNFILFLSHLQNITHLSNHIHMTNGHSPHKTSHINIKKLHIKASTRQCIKLQSATSIYRNIIY